MNEKTLPLNDVEKRKSWLGVIAIALGCLAISAAVLPTWVLSVFIQPEPVDKVVFNFAQKIKDRAAAKIKGTEYKEPVRKKDWYQIFVAAAMGLGVLTLIFSAISFARRDPWQYAVSSSMLGAGAIIFNSV